MFSSEATVFLSSYRVLSMYTRLWWVEDRYAIGRLPQEKTPIGKKVASPLKNPLGKLVGRIFQCPLAELGALPSSVFAVYLHMMIIVVVVMAMMMMMMDEPHCPWVIYNNDLYGVVQCSWQGEAQV